jgi:hypothetical protein
VTVGNSWKITPINESQDGAFPVALPTGFKIRGNSR